jgi:quercetin dioxygenase-like cupin family protein
MKKERGIHRVRRTFSVDSNESVQAQEEAMNLRPLRVKLFVFIGASVVGSVVLHAAIAVFRQDASSDYIGLRGGPAQLTARVLRTPVGEVTGGWHYHPGYVYNVVTQGTITIEDGCGQIRQYSKGEAFETSEGRVHRAYNLGTEDAIEYNMFVGPPDRPIGVNIPNNEHRCGPPSTVDECVNGGWTTFNHPFPFVNQGACVSYVNNRRRITLLVPEDPLQ